VDGSLIFGIGRRRTLASPHRDGVFGLDANDNFSLFNRRVDCELHRQWFQRAFLSLNDHDLHRQHGFYCPAIPQPLTATQKMQLGSNANVVNFTIDNADTLFTSTTDSAFSTLGGP